MILGANLIGEEQGRDGEHEGHGGEQATEDQRQQSQCPEVLGRVVILGRLVADNLGTLEEGNKHPEFNT